MFSWEFFGLNDLVLILFRIQTGRLQGWIGHSYVIFGHHRTSSQTLFVSIFWQITPFCAHSVANICLKNAFFLHFTRLTNLFACKLVILIPFLKCASSSVTWSQRCFAAAVISGKDVAASIALDWSDHAGVCINTPIPPQPSGRVPSLYPPTPIQPTPMYTVIHCISHSDANPGN